VARPNWEYIRVDVLMPTNPKVCGLPLASRWLLIGFWCYCGQHLTDGFVPDKIWRANGRARERQPLLDHGFAERVTDGYQMHDYLEHQRSRAEVEALREKRRKAGRRGGEAKANAVASARQMADQTPQRLPAAAPSKRLAEAEAEAEKELKADVGDQSSARTYAADDDLTKIIIDEIHHAAGREIDAAHAEAIAANILNGRTPDDPIAYVRTVIRREPDPRARWLNAAASHPSARTPAEAAFAAGIVPNGHPVDDETVAAFAAKLRQAITRSQP
jgi:hypothetical protein